MIYIIAVIAAMGGLLFGFDTGVISGAIPFFTKDLNIGSDMVELITTSGLVGAIIGALCCGKVTDLWGRKKVIMISAVIFGIGAVWSGIASDAISLISARIFLGIAIGVSSFTVPLYIAEISPSKVRGTLVSMFQLMITIGILVSYLSDLAFANENDISCWRPMFYVGAIPAIILFIGVFFLPESPRWLMMKGNKEMARKILLELEGGNRVESVIEMMEAEFEASAQESSSYKELLKPWLRTPLFIAIGIMFFQQFVGINTVIYYCPTIFMMAGFDGPISAIWASVGVGVVNIVFTLISVYFIDRLGRRKLYLTGLTGIAISLILLGSCFWFNAQLGEYGKWISIILVLLYVAFFAISIGPLAWLIVSEVFPQKVRGVGSSIGSLSVWLFNAIVTFTFFKTVTLFTRPGTEIIVNNENLGNPALAFGLYALIAISAIIWGYYYIPETKGISLENIEKHWRKGGNARGLK